MASVKTKKSLKNERPKRNRKGCDCPEICPDLNSNNSTINDSSLPMSSDSSDTTEWSSTSNGESTDVSTTDSDDEVQWECKCQIRKRGGKKKAAARASAIEIHNRNKKRLSHHGRATSSSSDYSAEYESSDECIPRKAHRKCCG